MKYFKMIFATVSLLIIANTVIAEGQRMMANPNVITEVRNTEDKVNNSNDFTSIKPGENAVKMASVSSKDKNKNTAVQIPGAVQLQSNNEGVKENNKDVVKKYNRFSTKQGEKKNKK